MMRSAIRLLPLIVAAMALGGPAATAKSETSRGKHIKKHTTLIRPIRHAGDFAAGRAWPTANPSYQSGEVCPGIARSFECKIWPPPINDDPDRKISGSDGG
jgi:hypothetical protein